jgi:hypothetical protein
VENVLNSWTTLIFSRRWTGYTEYIRATRNISRISFGKARRKRLIERCMQRWEGTVEMDFK